MRSQLLGAAGVAAWLCAAVPAAADPSLEELAFMAGSWCGITSRGGTQEEVWLPAKGGLMLGLHRDVSAAGKSAFEYLRIETVDGKVVYQASPGGRAPTPFELVEAGPGRAVFENPQNEFPKRILYALVDGGALSVRIEAGERAISWRWEAKESCEAPASANPESAPR